MKPNLILLVVNLIILLSCEGKCLDESIQVVDWVTDYKKTKKDTLVNYEIILYETEYIDPTELRYRLTLKNTNATYSNEFYVNFYHGIEDSYGEKEWVEHATNTALIKPNSTYTFEYVSDQASKIYNLENAFHISQKSKTYETLKKVETLQVQNTTFNSCDVNIEAIKKEQLVTRTLFNQKSIQNPDILLKENWSDGAKLNSMAWSTYEQTDSIELLNHALKQVERSIEIGENYYNLDTYAALLYKTNDLIKAKEMAIKAIAIARNDSIDYDITSELLRKINEKSE